jgi:hypothetical protein
MKVAVKVVVKMPMFVLCAVKGGVPVRVSDVAFYRKDAERLWRGRLAEKQGRAKLYKLIPMGEVE